MSGKYGFLREKTSFNLSLLASVFSHRRVSVNGGGIGDGDDDSDNSDRDNGVAPSEGVLAITNEASRPQPQNQAGRRAGRLKQHLVTSSIAVQ